MLTDTRIRAIKAPDRPFKLFDDRGLYLLVNPSGRHYWRWRYRFEGTEKTLALGVYPDVRLAAARAKRDAAKRELAERGIDPGAQKRAERLAGANTFKALAEEWLGKGCPGKGRRGRPKPTTISQLRTRLEKYVYPWIGNKPMATITLDDVRMMLERISRKGIHETANRVRALTDRVFRYAIATGRAERNFAADLTDAVVAVRATSFAAITEPRELGALLRAIDGYIGQPATMAALKLAPIVFVRPGELRAAEWAEFDLAGAQWSIPAEKMKQSLPHVVPLSRQAIEILSELQPVTGSGRYVFPSLRTIKRPLSENTLNAALRRLGYSKDEVTVHGFRTTASTLLHELGFRPDVIETQLAHKRPGVVGIYNRSHLIKQRTKMMQKWADYLHELKSRPSPAGTGYATN